MIGRVAPIACIAALAGPAYAAADIEALPAVLEPAGVLEPGTVGRLTFRARNLGPDAAPRVGMQLRGLLRPSQVELFAVNGTAPCQLTWIAYAAPVDLAEGWWRIEEPVPAGAERACVVGFRIPEDAGESTTVVYDAAFPGGGDPFDANERNDRGSVTIANARATVSAVPTLRPIAVAALVTLLVVACATRARTGARPPRG